MPLHKEGRARERIITMGPWGAGKSYAWVRLAFWLHKTHAPAHVYVIDTDHAVDRHAESFDGFDEVVTGWDTWEWTDYGKALEAFGKVGTKDDWLVIDLADKPWARVQDWYIEQVYGKNSARFYLEWKKESEKVGGSPLSDGFGTNWQVINREYNDFIQRVLRWPGHLLLCTPAEPVRQPDRSGKGGDEKEILDAFGGYGVRPGGQKHLGFQVFTVLLLNPKGGERWVYSSLKDLHRERPQNKKIDDFVLDYLVEVAGWQLA